MYKYFFINLEHQELHVHFNSKTQLSKLSYVFYKDSKVPVPYLFWGTGGRAGRYMWTDTGDLNDSGEADVGVVRAVMGLYPAEICTGTMVHTGILFSRAKL